MSSQSWRMTVYDLAPASRCTVAPGGHAFVYAAGGAVTVAGTDIATGEGAFASEGDIIESSHPAWIYEVVGARRRRAAKRACLSCCPVSSSFRGAAA